MTAQQGNISVEADNIFPIIKRFLYSDQEIFLRELVANAVDATSKVQTLANRSEVKGELGDLTIQIKLDEEAKTLTISDAGIGMTEEEVNTYLNQVAFSSAEAFLKKYEGETQIIGHFGLGFYSAFMVAEKVEVVTRSYKSDAAVRWTCEGDPTFTLEPAERDRRGTDIILHIGDEEKEFLEKSRIEGLLTKYCKFLPTAIQFGTKTETEYEGEGDDAKEIKTEVPNVINNTHPIWKKKASELKDEDYLQLFDELYPYSDKPLFWIHLSIDHPFNLTGVLYFPKVARSVEVQKNKIQLYSNQVYVTDDVSEIVPEFLTLLQGVIDSPDIPLNVSRSALQSDRNVRKITSYITKKVADKLESMYKNDREDFEEKWSDIGVFVKYGMLTNDKFAERGKDFALLKNVDGKHHSIDEYVEFIKANQTDKHDKTIGIYTNNVTDHDSFIQSAKSYGYDVLELDPVIDTHFVQHLEQKRGDITFVRVDSDTVDNLVQKDETRESVLSENEETKVKSLFDTATTAEADVQLKPLSPEDLPVMITRPEFMRRWKEMQAHQGGPMAGMDMPDRYNVVINSNHPLISGKLLKMRKDDKKAAFAKHLVNLALLNQNMLKGADLTAFIKESVEFLHES